MGEGGTQLSPGVPPSPSPTRGQMESTGWQSHRHGAAHAHLQHLLTRVWARPGTLYYMVLAGSAPTWPLAHTPTALPTGPSSHTAHTCCPDSRSPLMGVLPGCFPTAPSSPHTICSLPPAPARAHPSSSCPHPRTVCQPLMRTLIQSWLGYMWGNSLGGEPQGAPVLGREWRGRDGHQAVAPAPRASAMPA